MTLAVTRSQNPIPWMPEESWLTRLQLTTPTKPTLTTQREGGLNVHPAICFALQWNTRFRPDLPPNPRAAPFGVHAETDLRIYKPFRQNQTVTVQGQLISRKKISPGVYSVDRFKMTNSQGELLAELDYNGITRGATLNGPTKEIEPSPIAPSMKSLQESAQWTEEIFIPRHAGQQYTECSYIYNPIHTERRRCTGRRTA